MKPRWICGLYCRLSVEDSNNRESNSIQSQKIILSNFVDELSEAVIGKIYIDDGYSGSNFERPDFKNMIQAVEDGLINCVIVKDYSRFGRDYIDVGYYIEKYFPDKDVRFISVNDNHDSLNEEAQDDLKMPIMNMFNDLQSRETSKKVRSGLKARKQQGKFIGAFAPYGYLKSPTDKNQLIIDDNIEHIIKQLFDWRLEGYSTYNITQKLNDLGIPTPTSYKNSIGINHNPVNVKNSKVVVWNESTVRKILKNEAYIGNTVQNKRTTKNHRTKQIVTLDESKWIRVFDTHEPIIDIDTWNKVQSMFQTRTMVRPKNGKLSLFAGVLKCADCGRTMARRKWGNGSICYTCTTHRSDKNKCTTHSISERILKKSIFELIMLQVKLAADVFQLTEELKNGDMYDNKMKVYNTTFKNLSKEKELKNNILNDLYMDLKKSFINEEQYLNLRQDIEKELKEIELKLHQLEKNRPKEDITPNSNVLDVFENLDNKKELTRDMVVEFIDCIHVNDDRSLKIDFKFADELEELMDLVNLVS